MKRSLLLVVTACASAGLLLAASAINRRDVILYNATPSVPTGFYVRSDASIRAGAFVTVRAADVAADYAAMRHFTDVGDRFIKRVAAGEGALVCADGVSVTVGAEMLQRATHDSAGRALPTWEGCRVLQAGEMFLLGETPESFDSRYFGIVREDAIEGVWKRM